MTATCDMPDSEWGTLIVCVGVIFLILRHLRDEESEDDARESPSTMTVRAVDKGCRSD